MSDNKKKRWTIKDYILHLVHPVTKDTTIAYVTATSIDGAVHKFDVYFAPKGWTLECVECSSDFPLNQ